MEKRLWQDLKVKARAWKLHKLTELKLFSMGEWDKIPQKIFANIFRIVIWSFVFSCFSLAYEWFILIKLSGDFVCVIWKIKL